MCSVLHSFAIIPFNLVTVLCYFKFKSHHMRGFCKPCVNNELFTCNSRISLNLKESLWLWDRKLVNEYSEVRQYISTHSTINFKIFAALLLLEASVLPAVLQSSQLQRGPHKICYDAILHTEYIIVLLYVYLGSTAPVSAIWTLLIKWGWCGPRNRASSTGKLQLLCANLLTKQL